MPLKDYQAHLAYAKKRYIQKRTSILLQCKDRYAKNKDVILSKNREWRAQNKQRCVDYAVRYARDRYQKDPSYRLRICLRKRVQKYLKAETKSSPTMKLVGCSFEHLRLWLTFWFQPGMTWANYGKVWHVDHIRPCASFDLTDPAQQRECFHYMNLQPLFASENLSKGSKYVMQ